MTDHVLLAQRFQDLPTFSRARVQESRAERPLRLPRRPHGFRPSAPASHPSKPRAEEVIQLTAQRITVGDAGRQHGQQLSAITEQLAQRQVVGRASAA